MTRLALAIATCLVLLTGVLTRPAAAAPLVQGPLSATTHVTYDVRPDRGPVTVTWQLSVTNVDPGTTFNDSGPSLYYPAYPVPVLRGATGFSATGEEGADLTVELRELGEGPVVGADVYFGRALFYGDGYSFTFSYTLPAARFEHLLVTPAYVYLPAVTTGEAATVTVLTPEGGEWQSSVSALDCDESGAGEYECSAPDNVVAGAFVEVVRLGRLELRESLVASPRTTLRIQYFPGEGGWAEHVEQLGQRALPAIQAWFQLGGPQAFTEITERGYQEIGGAGGRAGCRPGSNRCNLELSPLLDDVGILHEFAHLWTPLDMQPWIAEGMAEFLAQRVAAQLGINYSHDLRDRFTPEALREVLGTEKLDGWEPRRSVINASPDEMDEVFAGYAASLGIFETLEATVGFEGLLDAYEVARARTPFDSQHFLDALEDGTGARLDDLFLASVFPDTFSAILSDRRDARAQLDVLRSGSGDVGLRLPDAIRQDVRDWNFASALTDLQEAAAALASYAAAKEPLDQGPGWWHRFGLHGKKPSARLEEAADAFYAGEYDRTIALADEAKATLDEAGTVALTRLLVAVSMFLLVVGGYGSALWWTARRRSSARSSSRPVLTN